MSNVEATIQEMVPGDQATIDPLEPIVVSAPVLTPVFWAGVAAGAGLWCAKHGCDPTEAEAVQLTEQGEELSADELLHGRASALRG